MSPSQESDKGHKPDPGKSPIVPNQPKHSKHALPLPGRQLDRNAGRQAYTTHVVRHDRRHHKPGR